MIRGLFFKLIGSALLLMATGVSLYGTHNRAGEITYVQISDLTYEITITTFTYVLSLADRNQLDVEWGDNSTSVAPRVSITNLPNYYKKNVYVARHTFPGPGVYKIVVQDPNRNFGIMNIPNSVNVVFSISTVLMVNPSLGQNDTPVLLNPPYDKAAVGYRFIHNPGAFDSNGDSLSYKLTVCTREDGKPIENYTFPPATNTFYVDSISGDLVWDAPTTVGQYNVAMEINEWRYGIKIGSVVRDMQIEVYETDNTPPENGSLRDYCVEAGDTVMFQVESVDADGDMITMISTSGVYNSVPCTASFDSISGVPGLSVYSFMWVTCQEAVRDMPYDILIKSEDNNPDIELFDLDNFRIKVLGPAPRITEAIPQGKYIRVNWESYESDYIEGFNIYRTEGATSFELDSCTNGIPSSLGFEKVGFAEGADATTFVDTNRGEGLENGVDYAYRIVAVYPGQVESKVSEEVRASLVTGVPVITNVSVVSTDISAGEIYIAWKKPDQLDTIPATGPYEYVISRAEGVSGSDFQVIGTFTTADLNDTTYYDTPLNTLEMGYTYRVELFNNETGNRFLIGEPGIASSTFILTDPGDNKAVISINRNVPWINSRYDIFRYNSLTTQFDSIASSSVPEYIDLEVKNQNEYCYLVRSIGAYSAPGLPDSLINYSQESCVVPFDNEPPCTPDLSVSTNCDSLYNHLFWRVDDPDCFEDIVGYNLFYKGKFEEDLSLLAEIDDRNIMSYIHQFAIGEAVAGCYSISAFDSVGNESPLSPLICIDSCNYYEIPNVFTPNNDGKNDILMARTTGQVEKVDFRLFNRSGSLIFRTEDPKINWNGTYKGEIIQPGVYFYQCDVYERRITGLETFSLSGFIHLITEKGAEPVIIEY